MRFHRPGPDDEALLELLVVEGGMDVAELIVRGRSLGKGQKAPQDRQLARPLECHLDPAARAAQHRTTRS